MNNSYNSNVFPGTPIYSGGIPLPNQSISNQNFDMPMEQSYIENILRLNKGKQATIYVSFPDANEFKDRIFTGIIEESGKDHLILSNNEKNEWYLIPLIYLNYATFNDKINYTKLY